MNRFVISGALVVVTATASATACGPMIGLEPPPDGTDAATAADAASDADVAAAADGATVDVVDAATDAPHDASFAADVDDSAVDGATDVRDAGVTETATPSEASTIDAAPPPFVGCESFHDHTSFPSMRELAVGPGTGVNRVIWAIGKPDPDAGTPDGKIYAWANGAWVQQPGVGTKISIAPDTGLPWITDSSGTVSDFLNGAWNTFSTSPKMSMVAAGPNGELWAIGTTPVIAGSSDNAVYKWSNGAWAIQNGAGIQVSIAPDTGMPWLLRSTGIVSFLDNGQWAATNASGSALSCVAAAPYGVLWGNGTMPWMTGSPDLGIARSSDGMYWKEQNGGSLRVVVSPSGVPWAVNDYGTVFFGTDGATCPN